MVFFPLLAEASAENFLSKELSGSNFDEANVSDISTMKTQEVVITISEESCHRLKEESAIEFPTGLCNPTEDSNWSKNDEICSCCAECKALKRKLKKSNIKQLCLRNSLRSFLSDDQIDFLLLKQKLNAKWSTETLKHSFKMRKICRANGYKFLLSKGYPLPSEDSLKIFVKTGD